MSILSVKLIRAGRTGGKDFQGRKYQYKYRVVTDDVSHDVTEIIEAAGIPLLGELHPIDPFATCKSVDAELEDDSSDMRWIVTADYDRTGESTDSEEEDDTGNPLDRRWHLSGSSLDRDIAIEKDVNGDPILTSAGEPIRGITAPYCDYAFTLTGNVGSIDLAQIASFRNKVNDAVLFTAEENTARLSRFAFETKRHSQVGLYFSVTYEFAFRDGGWDEEVLDQGFYELDSTGNRVLIVIEAKDADGNVVDQYTTPEPYPLDGTGQRDDSDPPLGETIDVQKFLPADFSELGIPTTFAELE